MTLPGQSNSPARGWPQEHMLEAAWGIIANAWGGDWAKADHEWQAAALRWRDAYHELLEDERDGLCEELA